MLNDEELAEFLLALTAFMTNAGLSMATTGTLFGVSASSLSRWYKSNPEKRHGAARWVANPVKQKVAMFDAISADRGLYGRLVGLSQPEKLEMLRAVLQDTATWA